MTIINLPIFLQPISVPVYTHRTVFAVTYLAETSPSDGTQNLKVVEAYCKQESIHVNYVHNFKIEIFLLIIKDPELIDV